MVRGQYAECMKIKPSYEQNNHSENRLMSWKQTHC